MRLEKSPLQDVCLTLRLDDPWRRRLQIVSLMIPNDRKTGEGKTNRFLTVSLSRAELAPKLQPAHAESCLSPVSKLYAVSTCNGQAQGFPTENLFKPTEAGPLTHSLAHGPWQEGRRKKFKRFTRGAGFRLCVRQIGRLFPGSLHTCALVTVTPLSVRARQGESRSMKRSRRNFSNFLRESRWQARLADHDLPAWAPDSPVF